MAAILGRLTQNRNAAPTSFQFDFPKKALRQRLTTCPMIGTRHASEMAMHIAKQLALFLANKPGTLTAVCEVLAEAKINIYAISTSDTIDHSVVRLVVDHPQNALKLFERRGTLAVVTDVLMIDGANTPGSLLDIAKTLAEEGINIEYAYCATSPQAKKGLMIMRTNNVQKSLKVLNKAPLPAKKRTISRKSV
jgi:hypothetical protein